MQFVVAIFMCLHIQFLYIKCMYSMRWLHRLASWCCWCLIQIQIQIYEKARNFVQTLVSLCERQGCERTKNNCRAAMSACGTFGENTNYRQETAIDCERHANAHWHCVPTKPSIEAHYRPEIYRATGTLAICVYSIHANCYNQLIYTDVVDDCRCMNKRNRENKKMKKTKSFRFY